MPTGAFQNLPVVVLALFSCCAAFSESPARAASGDRIGDAVVITNTVMADFEKDRRKLAAGDDVRQDETIEVSADAQGELKLDDDTKLALGAGSRLVLDKFVYDSDKKTGSIVLNLAKGTFRFITGIAAKPTYVINTPNASITVRGTIFDLFILEDKSIWLLLHEGAVEVTGSRNVCQVLDQPGRLMRISNSGRVGPPVDWSKLPGNKDVPFDTAFPFVAKAPQIDPTPLLTRAAIIDGAQADAPPKVCLNPHPRTKIRKADDGSGGGGDKPKATKTKRASKASSGETPKRTKTAKRRPETGGSDDSPALDIVIGIGVGIGRSKHRDGGKGGSDYPRRGGTLRSFGD